MFLEIYFIQNFKQLIRKFLLVRLSIHGPKIITETQLNLL